MTKTITFVAFGDSLTVGYIPFRIAVQPYSRFLQEMMDQFLTQIQLKRVVKVRVINRGVNGDLTSGMLLRFEADVIRLNPQYVIILGGTNDIGWGFPVEEIFLNLHTMYELALQHAIDPIACTVPSLIGWDEGIAPRMRLNQLLTRHCTEKGVPRVDLFALTCDPKTKRLLSEYSSDGLHMNMLGYRKMAEAIFQKAVKDLVTNVVRGM